LRATAVVERLGLADIIEQIRDFMRQKLNIAKPTFAGEGILDRVTGHICSRENIVLAPFMRPWRKVDALKSIYKPFSGPSPPFATKIESFPLHRINNLESCLIFDSAKIFLVTALNVENQITRYHTDSCSPSSTITTPVP
jgi:hypothetical protein